MTLTKSFVILDTMNFWMDTAIDELKKAISKTDLIVINDEEAEQLTNEKNLDAAANKIFEMGPKTVIIKKGDQGSEIFNSTESFYIPAYPVKAVVDPTGAEIVLREDSLDIYQLNHKLTIVP